MNKLPFLISCFLFLLITSCTDKQAEKELAELHARIETLGKENTRLQDKLNAPDNKKGELIHYVFLDVKNDVSEKQYDFLIKEIYSLAKLSGVKDLKVGKHENMDDDRALENRDINFEMRFKNKKNYYAYQKSKEHMRVREILSPFLAKPPLTYDYIVQ